MCSTGSVRTHSPCGEEGRWSRCRTLRPILLKLASELQGALRCQRGRGPRRVFMTEKLSWYGEPPSELYPNASFLIAGLATPPVNVGVMAPR